nr:hypothetical protein [uncultured Sellimonas sp.]
MMRQHICIDALENKTIAEKKEQCRENYNELKSGLLSYPMKNCFKLFYRQMYKDFIFLGIKLACESGNMTFMLNGLFQGNRIGMIQNNCLHTAQDQSGGLVNIILAFAANDLKLISKSMPVSLGTSDNGYYNGHYNMMYAIYWKDQEVGREAEKQLLKFQAAYLNYAIPLQDRTGCRKRSFLILFIINQADMLRCLFMGSIIWHITR